MASSIRFIHTENHKKGWVLSYDESSEVVIQYDGETRERVITWAEIEVIDDNNKTGYDYSLDI